MVPNDILSKVTLEGDERGGINWVEEVEMTYPATDLAEDYFCDLGKLRRKRLRKRILARRVNDKRDVCYRNEMRLGRYLAMRQGKAGNVEVEKQLESKYIDRLFRRPGVCKNSGMQDFGSGLNPPKESNFVDVQSMAEGGVREVINNWEDGLKIITRCNPVTSKKEYYIVLLDLSPRQVILSFLSIFI